MAHRPVASILVLTATIILALPAKGQQNVNPKNDGAHVALGMALAKKGDLDGAIAEYRKALRLNPKNEEAHALLGVALATKKDWDGAIAEYREALRLNPKDENAHLLGVALERKGNYEEALGEYRTAHELDPPKPRLPPRLRAPFEAGKPLGPWTEPHGNRGRKASRNRRVRPSYPTLAVDRAGGPSDLHRLLACLFCPSDRRKYELQPRAGIAGPRRTRVSWRCPVRCSYLSKLAGIPFVSWPSTC